MKKKKKIMVCRVCARVTEKQLKKLKQIKNKKYIRSYEKEKRDQEDCTKTKNNFFFLLFLNLILFYF